MICGRDFNSSDEKPTQVLKPLIVPFGDSNPRL